MFGGATTHAMVIYYLVKSQLNCAIRAEIDARVKLAGDEAGRKHWEKENDDFDFRSTCPYNVERSRELVQKAVDARAEWEATLGYVITTFLDGEKPIQGA